MPRAASPTIDPTAVFTLFAGLPGHVLTKTITLGDDGKLSKEGPRIGLSHAETVRLSLSDLPNYLGDLHTNQCLIHGVAKGVEHHRMSVTSYGQSIESNRKLTGRLNLRTSVQRPSRPVDRRLRAVPTNNSVLVSCQGLASFAIPPGAGLRCRPRLAEIPTRWPFRRQKPFTKRA